MEKHDHRHKEELLQQMRRQAEIRPEQNDSDQKGKCFAGISMDQVLHYVTDVDYGTYLETWVETAVNGSQAL